MEEINEQVVPVIGVLVVPVTGVLVVMRNTFRASKLDSNFQSLENE